MRRLQSWCKTKAASQNNISPIHNVVRYARLSAKWIVQKPKLARTTEGVYSCETALYKEQHEGKIVHRHHNEHRTEETTYRARFQVRTDSPLIVSSLRLCAYWYTCMRSPKIPSTTEMLAILRLFQFCLVIEVKKQSCSLLSTLHQVGPASSKRCRFFL